jgi:hypothetical protein
MSMKRANSTTKFVHSWSRFGKPDPWAQENRARVPNVQADPLFVQGVQRTRLAEAAQRPIFIPDGTAT